VIEKSHSVRNPEEVKVLVVGTESDLQDWVRRGLEGVPHHVISRPELGIGPGEADEANPDLALVSEDGRPEFPGRLSAFKLKHPRCQILFVGREDSDLSPRQLGPAVVRHWFFRPADPEGIVDTLQAAGRSLSRAWRERQRHTRALTGLDAILGQHPALLGVLDLAKRVAASPSTAVLIQGETGTGKGLLARAIHGESPRQNGPFVDINCAAIPPALLESELFGHVKGAFTTAVREKPGLLELADGGTAFLDEIGELDLSLQAKILKFLDDGMIRRVQGTASTRVDVRVLAATNRDLQNEIKAGRFRLDLYHRLSVMVLQLPPLRERPTDVPDLARHFLSDLSRRILGKPIQWTQEATEALAEYAWPGNVRELINVTERLTLLSDGARPIALQDLPPGMVQRTPTLRVATAAAKPEVKLPPEGISFEAVERAVLETALQEMHGNVTRAAAFLGMGRGSLRYRMDKLGLQEHASNRRGRPMGRRRPRAA
jgi:two-component system, NtrC family, response regulator AtoC